MSISNSTIGILDSGVGGFSVVRPLLERVPKLSFLYVADIAHVPYSNKTPEELERVVGRILQFFLDQKVKLVVFACNTSSALVLPRIRSSFPVPVYGVVEPGVAAALEATQGKGIGMVANEVTAKSGIFSRLIHQKNKSIPVYEEGCPILVSLVESGDVHSPRAQEAVDDYCRPFQGKIDTLIFGCTHFPYLEEQFRKSLPRVKLIDPAPFLADQLKPVLQPLSAEGVPYRKLFSTKLSPHVSAWAKKVLGWEAEASFLSLDSVEPWMPKATR